MTAYASCGARIRLAALSAALAGLALGPAAAAQVPGWIGAGVSTAAGPPSGRPGSAPGAATLVAVDPQDDAPANPRALLTFSPRLPEFSILANDATTVLIAFAGARLAPRLAFAGGRHGIVQSFAFAQNGELLTLSITGAAPLHVSAAAAAGSTIQISTTRVGDPREPGPSAAPAHGEAPPDVFEIVPLKYADVSEVVGLLTTAQSVKPNDTFQPQEPAFGSAGIGGGYSSGVTTPSFNTGVGPAGGLDPRGQTVDETIGFDRRLNAVIVKGSRQTVDRLKAQIAKIDVPVTGVAIETVFVELTETGARNLGLEFNNANSEVATVAYNFSSGDYPGAANTAKGGGVTVNLQAGVYAQIAKGNGRILSKPLIAAQSGSTAKIITGDALPILTSIALSGVNAVQQQVQYVNVGVTLQIAPRVSDDGYVTSHIFAEVSTVTGYSQGYPTISQREAATSATVRDGQTFLIGGLRQEAKLDQTVRVPGLGSLPLVGGLFRADHFSRSKTDLYILITPRIVRAGARLPPAAAAEVK